MRYIALAVLFCCASFQVWGQANPDGPSNEKAQKTYKEAFEYLKQRKTGSALECFKKADKQDDGHCLPCQQKMIKYGVELRDWKTAETAAAEMVSHATGDKPVAIAHYQFGVVLMREALDKRKQEIFQHAHEELSKALETSANFPQALYEDGRVLAQLRQDDAAKAQFQKYVAMRSPEDPDRQRALRYISRPELARARMAPPFAVKTLDGQNISLDDLQGKVVLLDFWATWCGPCRAALPHMQSIAKKFAGQPLVILSVSLDRDQAQWKEFVEKNEMTWLQYYDGGFEGPVSRLFGVNAIPHTFTIDADGVLQDENIGDASIEGKLKKLIARAKELQEEPKSAANR